MSDVVDDDRRIRVILTSVDVAEIARASIHVANVFALVAARLIERHDYTLCTPTVVGCAGSSSK